MHKVPMTASGAARLREELHHLKTEERPRIVRAIAEARAHGDLRENAEYHSAKDAQGFIEARIREIENKLAHAQVIDVKQIAQDGRVVFGATVALIDIKTDESIRYQIVGDDEADLKQGKLSISSPIARALIGKTEGMEVEIEVPSGTVYYEIDAVIYEE